MRAFRVDFPHMNEDRLGPRCWIIQTATSIFSPPRSPRTREGVPYVLVASRKRLSTVDARLSVLARKPTTCLLCK